MFDLFGKKKKEAQKRLSSAISALATRVLMPDDIKGRLVDSHTYGTYIELNDAHVEAMLINCEKEFRRLSKNVLKIFNDNQDDITEEMERKSKQYKLIAESIYNELRDNQKKEGVSVVVSQLLCDYYFESIATMTGVLIESNQKNEIDIIKVLTDVSLYKTYIYTFLEYMIPGLDLSAYKYFDKVQM